MQHRGSVLRVVVSVLTLGLAIFGILALVIFVLKPAHTAIQPATDHAAGRSGLSCFSIAAERPDKPSCDKLCAEKEAVCTAVNTGRLNVTAPALNCGDPSVPSVSLCRCCALAR